MTYRYIPCYNAHVENDDLKVYFYRLYRDVTDPMSDALNKSWEAQGDFIINVKKLRTTRKVERKHQLPPFEHLTMAIETTDVKVLDEMEIRIHGKDAANHIWWLAKHGVCFDTLKQMHEANVF